MNRPLGRVFAAGAYKVGLGPNAVTVISGLTTGAGVLVLALLEPTVTTGLAVALLLVLGFALDSSDGQVARLTGRGSIAGEWLDHVVDSAKMVLLHAAVLVSLYRYGEADPAWYLVPLAFQAVTVVMFSGGILTDLLKRSAVAGPAPTRASTPPAPSTLRSLLLLPADYGVLAWSFVLLGLGPVFLGVYTVLAATNALLLGALLVKWFRELSALR
ncbi:CDP-alcohol phosphatidyltransferase family protein [Paraoerskovia sediminicola]|uniref:CDP-alcohol phosphatidyltransferase family protein n=1 Tax=Paraoerskovia sediminicola TaxID=1138587 RepID=UPI0025733A71|nr:CDP-alcohol phosphatidyltransferase family protein [Paraoerskovia sediminicola]